MGLIGKVFGAITGLPTASDRALLDTLCLAAISDGDASALELGYALEIALDLPGFQKLRKKDLEARLAESLQGIRSRPERTAVLESVVSRLDSPEDREQAYTLAAVIQYVDGNVAASETAFLTAFRQALGLAPARAEQILGEVEREIKQAQREDLMNG